MKEFISHPNKLSYILKAVASGWWAGVIKFIFLKNNLPLSWTMDWREKKLAAWYQSSTNNPRKMIEIWTKVVTVEYRVVLIQKLLHKIERPWGVLGEQQEKYKSSQLWSFNWWLLLMVSFTKLGNTKRNLGKMR